MSKPNESIFDRIRREHAEKEAAKLKTDGPTLEQRMFPVDPLAERLKRNGGR